MQDDAYMVSRDGWKVTISLPKDKKGNIKKSFTYEDISCDLLPSMVLVNACYPKELATIQGFNTDIEDLESKMASIVEENTDSFSDFLNDKGQVKYSDLKAGIKKAKKTPADYDTSDVDNWNAYNEKAEELDRKKKALKEAVAILTSSIQGKYKTLTEDEVRELVFSHKWMPTMRQNLESLMLNAQQKVSSDMHALNARYENTLDSLANSANEFESAVMSHLKEMGF